MAERNGVLMRFGFRGTLPEEVEAASAYPPDAVAAAAAAAS